MIDELDATNALCQNQEVSKLQPAQGVLGFMKRLCREDRQKNCGTLTDHSSRVATKDRFAMRSMVHKLVRQQNKSGYEILVGQSLLIALRRNLKDLHLVGGHQRSNH